MRISGASTVASCEGARSPPHGDAWKHKGRWIVDPPPRYAFCYRGSGQLGDQRLGFGFLLLVALMQHFLQDLARALDIAHLLIRLGEIELGGRIVPLAVEHRWRRVLECRTLGIEGEVELVEFNCRCRTRQLWCGRAGAGHRGLARCR